MASKDTVGSYTLSLETVIRRLEANDQVEGVLVIGSLARGALTPASDYDIVIVLGDAPLPWFVGVTTIDGRLTDLVFVASATVEAVRGLSEPVAANHHLAPVIRWLRTGDIVVDRDGRLKHLQRTLQEGAWVREIGEAARYGAWFGINYNLAVAKWMAQSDDEVYRRALLIRMAVYGHSDIWHGYFTIRGLAWDGDKAAVKYLLSEDPAYLEACEQFMRASTVEEKLDGYERVATLATAPLGGLWPPAMTVTNCPEANTIWQELLAGASD